MKPPSHPQHPLYKGAVQPSEIVSVPWTKITGAPQIPPLGSHMLNDSSDWESMAMPGPAGVAGAAGASGGGPGPIGPPGADGEPGEDAPIVPGPAGPAGAAGAAGTQGLRGPPGVDGEPYDDWLTMIPGPAGPQGTAGTPGAPGGGGGGTTLVMLTPFDEGFDEDRAAFLRPAINRITETNAGITVSGGEVSIGPQDTVQEGGQVTLQGAGVYNAWTMDNFQGHVRWFSAGTLYADLSPVKLSLQNGSFLEVYNAADTTTGIFLRAAANNHQIRSNDDGSGAQQDPTKPSWAVAVGEGATDDFALYRRPAAGAYTLLWRATNGGHWTPGLDVAYDIGTSAIRVRDVYAAQLTNAAPATNSLVTTSGTVVQYGLGSSWQQLNFYTGGTARWHLPVSGHWLAVLDNTYDIGNVATLRPRTVNAGTSVVTPLVNATTKLQIGGVDRMNTTKPVWVAPTAAQLRTVIATGDAIATVNSHLAALVVDLRLIGILA